jgi:hypothetical protein
MPSYPLPYTSQAYYGSQWQASFQFYESDGQTLLDISADTFEVVVRTSTQDTATPAVSVNSDGSTASGSIVVTTGTSTILITLTPTATSSLLPGETYAVTGWVNQDTATANVFMSGSLLVIAVATSV